MIASLVKKPSQPNVLITPGPVEKILDLLGLVVVVLLWIYTLMRYDQMPDQVVVHLNLEGNADRLGDKTQLFFLPGLATFLYGGLVWLNRYPHLFNYLVEITPENAARQYLLGTRFMRFINLSVLTLFAGIHLEFIHMTRMDPSAPVQNPGLVIMVGAHLFITFVGLFFYLVKSSNAK